MLLPPERGKHGKCSTGGHRYAVSSLDRLRSLFAELWEGWHVQDRGKKAEIEGVLQGKGFLKVPPNRSSKPCRFSR